MKEQHVQFDKNTYIESGRPVWYSDVGNGHVSYYKIEIEDSKFVLYHIEGFGYKVVDTFDTLEQAQEHASEHYAFCWL